MEQKGSLSFHLFLGVILNFTPPAYDHHHAGIRTWYPALLIVQQSTHCPAKLSLSCKALIVLQNAHCLAKRSLPCKALIALQSAHCTAKHVLNAGSGTESAHNLSQSIV
eukprot:1160321-Pelagomonas_calceolata.AAC.12